MREEINKYEGGLEVFSRGYEKFGFIRRSHTFSNFPCWVELLCVFHAGLGYYVFY